MENIYIFDVDGTLTPSRRAMTEDFEVFFSKWAKKNIFYLVSGSNLEKIQEQLPSYILDLAAGVFPCGGNQLFINDTQKYNREFKPPEDLLNFLKEKLKNTNYTTKAGNHIEDRGSMLNFSIVGRDCSLEQRQDYFEYDSNVGERSSIAEEINAKWKNIEAVIGGQISIDITPKGMNKSQVLNEVKKYFPTDQYIFIGDRTMEGGNDYPLAKLMGETEGCGYYKVEDYKETRQILESLE